MGTARRWRHLAAAALLSCFMYACPAAAADYEGFPFVNDDGTLDIHQATIQLYGILIPETDENCMFFQQPPECAPRAALALKFNLHNRYVRCDRKGELPGGIIVARCTADGTDLAAQLLRQGWAAALPDAPPEYTLLQEIARQHGVGIWGIPVDRYAPARPLPLPRRR